MDKFLATFSAYLIELLLGKFYNKLFLPAVKKAIEGGNIIYDKVDGRIKVRKLNKAEQSGSKEDYIDAVNDILD